MSIFINLKKASYFPNLPDGIYEVVFWEVYYPFSEISQYIQSIRALFSRSSSWSRWKRDKILNEKGVINLSVRPTHPPTKKSHTISTITPSSHFNFGWNVSIITPNSLVTIEYISTTKKMMDTADKTRRVWTRTKAYITAGYLVTLYILNETCR